MAIAYLDSACQSVHRLLRTFDKEAHSKTRLLPRSQHSEHQFLPMYPVDNRVGELALQRSIHRSRHSKQQSRRDSTHPEGVDRGRILIHMLRSVQLGVILAIERVVTVSRCIEV